MKAKFTSIDTAAMVASLRPQLLGARVVNVYDIAGKLFLIKFSSSLVAATGPEEDDTGKSTLLKELEDVFQTAPKEYDVDENADFHTKAMFEGDDDDSDDIN